MVPPEAEAPEGNSILPSEVHVGLDGSGDGISVFQLDNLVSVSRPDNVSHTIHTPAEVVAVAGM